MNDIHPFNHPFTEEPLKQNMIEIEKINNRECNPMAALPAWISVVAQK